MSKHFCRNNDIYCFLDLETLGWLGEEKGGESWKRRVTWRLGEGDQGHELAVSNLVSHRRGTGDNHTPPSAKKALIEILIKV